MNASRRNVLLCASILSVGAFSSPAIAAAEHVHAKRHLLHHKPQLRSRAVSNAPVVSGVTPASSVGTVQRARVGKNTLASVESTHAEEVTVTGSMLSTSRNANANPVQIVTSKQIMQSGSTTMGDFLARLPSIGSNSTNNTNTNGGGGVSCADIRNLGQQRVLVLIDGKRTAVNGSSNCVDMNTIPVQLVKQVEILKDGGSELYGADAVSGVINIKLRHDISTGNITMRGGIAGQGDDKTGMISAYKGWNFDDRKGNITLFGSYMTQGGVRQRNRSWADPVQNDLGGSSFGSAYTPQGRVYDVSGNLMPGQKTTRYDFSQDQMLLNRLQNATLSGDAHYKFDKHFNLYSNVLYSHRNSYTQMAAEPSAGSIPPSNYASLLYINKENPFNTYGQDVTLRKRYNEFGPRKTEDASDTYTAKVGLDGEIIHNWMYDASYTYGWNQDTSHMVNMGNYAHLMQVYGMDQLDPNDPNSAIMYNPGVCQGSAGCALANPFAPLSGQALEYANATLNNHSYYQLRDWNVRIHNNKVARLPWKNGGDFAVAMGMERRSESETFKPDPLITSGQSMTNTQNYTGGGFHVWEGYLEGKLTLLKNTTMAKDLSIDGQGRYSSYNTFGSAKNWKAAINWSPVRDVHFRGTLGTSTRQPSVYELYGGQSMSYATAMDPCDMNQVGTYGAQSSTVALNCAQQGINSQNFQMATSSQVPSIVGGNSKLRPELGRTYTFGVELTPRWVRGFSASVEYWHTRVKNTISAIPTQYLLDQCYTGANTGYCSSILRNSQGQIQTATTLDANLGGLRTGGIDFDMDYHLRVTPRDMVLLSNNLQDTISYQQQYLPGGEWYNYTGRLQYNNAVGFPRIRDYATLTWQHGPIGLTYMMQYTSGMVWNTTQQDVVPGNGVGRWKTPGMFQHDVTLNYRLNRWNFEAGIQNIANKKPPFVASGQDNSMGNLYGGFYPGRYFFTQAGLNF
ncbi:TonB-dependent receptor plug domain-containing protein [Swingsia samuiensis]|uniref:TonB-dependent receptor n=1 Tax=Swingsia samuiensis TaxID=1293412 RepID=A0A4Y6ULQ4_9PROT|nr:TonB-dependent receptor [Swingsia samuiensis]QDH17588.1 TonB-dependent receptor [Swingsia samuiensis]